MLSVVTFHLSDQTKTEETIVVSESRGFSDFQSFNWNILHRFYCNIKKYKGVTESLFSNNPRFLSKRSVLERKSITMVHVAYDAVELVRGAPTKIEVAAIYGSKILAGCADGSLRIFTPLQEDSDQGEGIQRGGYVQEKAVSMFWKKLPSAMEVSPSRNLLISLSEWIVFHRLPNLEVVAAISMTKTANVYAWDDQKGMLCVAKQKKVAIFRLDGQ